MMVTINNQKINSSIICRVILMNVEMYQSTFGYDLATELFFILNARFLPFFAFNDITLTTRK